MGNRKMQRRQCASLLGLWALLVCGAAPRAAAVDQSAVRALPVARAAVTGDFDDILAARKRRLVVLVTYSRTLYFNDRGQERGMVADLARDFERFLNAKLKTGARPITVVLAPVTRDQLLPGLSAGLGDIAAAGLTATPERLQLVDFVVPPGGATTTSSAVSEVVITGPKSAPVHGIDDLSGRTIEVRPSTSYYQSLLSLNATFARQGRAPMILRQLPDAIQDEDMLEMVNAGLLSTIVADDWLAALWQPVLPAITINRTAVVRSGGNIGWAIRKHSPQLQAQIDDFFKRFVARQGVVRMRNAQYARQVKKLRDPSGTREWARFEQTLKLFDKYGTQYNFDPLMLVAQGFQESRLDQQARSRVGAIGIMQIMPAVGKQLKVGDIHIAESNIHAGAKYMDMLMTRYFQDATFSDADRSLFAFASYNAGPGNIRRMRAEAKRRGLDSNQWFNHVEAVTAEKIGVETTAYVRNIFKYYVAYKLMAEVRAAQEKARADAVPFGR